MDPKIRLARPEDRLAVRSLLDAAVLQVGDVETRIDAGDVLVATVGTTPVGVLVLEPQEDAAHITGIAVRRRRRNRGIGTALVRAAAERRGRLTATFAARVRPFYDSLEFEIEPIDDGERYRGVFTE